MTATERPDLFKQFGDELLGPWEEQSESVLQAWLKLAAEVDRLTGR